MKKVFDIWEYCPYCDDDVKLNRVKQYCFAICPSCGKMILPCALCGENDYKHCNDCEKYAKEDYKAWKKSQKKKAE